jgi:putative transposase
MLAKLHYPYLLRKLAVTRPNQVWAADISYIPMARGFVYLVAIVDWFSRRVLSWRVNHAGCRLLRCCLGGSADALRNAGHLQLRSGQPIYEHDFTGVLKREAIAISIDGDVLP